MLGRSFLASMYVKRYVVLSCLPLPAGKASQKYCSCESAFDVIGVSREKECQKSYYAEFNDLDGEKLLAEHVKK